MKLIKVCGVFLIFAIRNEAQIPEPLMPYDNYTSVCYGPGTHGQRFRPSCPDSTTVIAVQGVRVGAKTLDSGCPSSVTEWTNHTGSYLVDHMDFTKIVNESGCCFPDVERDCILDYSYLDSGLEYKYHKGSSGYSTSQSDFEVAWQQTTCNDSSEYLTGTNYMFMDYSCIERTRIGNLCSNHTYTVTSGAFYLYNTGYPESVSAAIGVCECRVQSNASAINFYSIDTRLETYEDNCEQTLNATDSNGTIFWDCQSSPVFNVTKETKFGELKLTFKNSMAVDSGHVWIGVSAESPGVMRIECAVEEKDVRTTSSYKPTMLTTKETNSNTSEVSTASIRNQTAWTETSSPAEMSTNVSTETTSPAHVSTEERKQITSPAYVSTEERKETTSPAYVSTDESTETTFPGHMLTDESTETSFPSHMSQTTTSALQKTGSTNKELTANDRTQSVPVLQTSTAINDRVTIPTIERYYTKETRFTAAMIGVVCGILVLVLILLISTCCCYRFLWRNLNILKNRISPAQNVSNSMEQGITDNTNRGTASPSQGNSSVRRMSSFTSNQENGSNGEEIENPVECEGSVEEIENREESNIASSTSQIIYNRVSHGEITVYVQPSSHLRTINLPAISGDETETCEESNIPTSNSEMIHAGLNRNPSQKESENKYIQTEACPGENRNSQRRKRKRKKKKKKRN